MKKIQIIRERSQVQHFIEKLEGVELPLQMIQIPSGDFYMGAPEDEDGSEESERPQRLVTVNSFFMGRYPITNAQWDFVAKLPQEQKKLNFSTIEEGQVYSTDLHPVVRVSWYDGLEFCARLSRYSGKRYRLPSEAEWEYACRSVFKKNLTLENWNKQYRKPFYFGQTIDSKLANYNGKITYGNGEVGDYPNRTKAVNAFQAANAFGLSQMHGQVWEWCADPWHETYDGAPSDSKPWDERNMNNTYYLNIVDNLAELLNDKRARILRGGSWNDFPRYCRSAIRVRINPGFENHFNGLRIVVSS